MFLGNVYEERAQIFHCLEAVKRLTPEPSNRQVLQMRCFPFNHLLYAFTDRRQHRSSWEILIAVGATEVTVFGREQNQFEDVLTIVSLTEGELDLAILVGPFGHQKAIVREILDHSFRLALIALFQQGLNALPLLWLNDAHGPRVAVPQYVTAVWSRRSKVVFGGLPLQLCGYRFDLDQIKWRSFK